MISGPKSRLTLQNLTVRLGSTHNTAAHLWWPSIIALSFATIACISVKSNVPKRFDKAKPTNFCASKVDWVGLRLEITPLADGFAPTMSSCGLTFPDSSGSFWPVPTAALARLLGILSSGTGSLPKPASAVRLPAAGFSTNLNIS